LRLVSAEVTSLPVSLRTLCLGLRRGEWKGNAPRKERKTLDDGEKRNGRERKHVSRLKGGRGRKTIEGLRAKTEESRGYAVFGLV